MQFARGKRLCLTSLPTPNYQHRSGIILDALFPCGRRKRRRSHAVIHTDGGPNSTRPSGERWDRLDPPTSTDVEGYAVSPIKSCRQRGLPKKALAHRRQEQPFKSLADIL